MQRLHRILRTSLITFTTALMVFVSSPAVYADTTPVDPIVTPTTTQVVDPAPAATSTNTPAPVVDPVTPPAQSQNTNNQQTGPTSPTGSASTSYTFNPTSGLWENDYYTWNPKTGQTKPKTTPTYSYNPTTKLWDTTAYVYDAPSGKYVPNIFSTNVVPSGANATIGTTGPDSTNAIKDGSNNTGVFDSFYNANISNALNSVARSGDATIANNTTGGNAGTGNATNEATILNLLQSSAGLLGSNVATFTKNITGNVQGDLLIDPSQFSKVQPIQNPSNDLTVKVVDNGVINNNVNLDAASGAATVQGNTLGGDATSGNANSVANLVNLINTAITGQQSFVGTLNIYGNLDGDVLLPPDMLNSLIASSGPGSNNNISGGGTQNINANLTNNQAVNNNVTTTAKTGDATIANNTSAGTATTGNAATNVTILNLTGRNVVASNAMLVFVNVLGRWMGLIMDAPTGSTAAAVGGGVANNSLAPNLNANIDLTNNSLINNNVNVAAASGDANVTNNTTGGNAKTGNATASANIANLENTNLSVSDWFGILFINVFGNWHGSFGVNTDAGNPAVPSSPVASTAVAGNGSVLQFVPKTTSGRSNLPLPLGNVIDAESDANNQQADQAVLASTDQPVPPAAAQAIGISGGLMNANAGWVLPAFGVTLGMLLLGGERLVAVLSKRRVAKAV